MQIPRLSEFTSPELTFLYLTLKDRLTDIQSKLDMIETFPASRVKYDLYAGYVEQHDMCSQIMTKVDEAQKIVIERDQILRN